MMSPTSTSLMAMVALIPMSTMPQSDIAHTFPGSSARSKRQESGINTADFLLDFLEELPQDAATLITHPDSGKTMMLFHFKKFISEIVQKH